MRQEIINDQIKILLVEDDPGDARLVRHALSKCTNPSFGVEVSKQLSVAVERLCEDNFDAVLLDLSLPDSKSLGGISKILAEDPKIPIIVLTGLDDEEVGLEALKYGAEDYLTKGTGVRSVLPRSIRYAIERKKMKMSLQESEERCSTLVAMGSDGIVLMQGREIVFANHIFYEMFGFDQFAIVGKNLLELLSENMADVLESMTEKERRGISQTLANAAKGEVVSHDYQLPFKKTSGEVIWIEITANPIEYKGRIAEMALLRNITDRKEMEDSLREAKESYSAIVEYGSDGIIILLENLKIAFVNQRLASLGGYTIEEMIGLDITKIVGSDFFDMAYDRYRCRLAGEDVSSVYEIEVFHKDGHVIPVELSSAKMEYKGNLADVIFVRDITERKHVNTALHESEERHRVLFESSPDGILIAGLQTANFQYANPSVCKLLGYSMEELLTMNVADIHPKDELEYVISAFEAQAAGEKTLASNIPCLRKDGTVIYVDVNTTKTLINGKECNVGFFRDITAHKQAEDLIVESETRFREIFENVSDEIVYMDNLGVIIDVNQRCEDIHGHSRSELLGLTLRDLDIFDDQSMARVYDLFKQVVLGDSCPPLIEVKIRHKTGKAVPVEVSTRPIINNGKVEAIISIIRDVSERKQAEEELIRVKMEKDAQIIQSAKLASLGEMATGVAHEINQPLSVIKITSTGLLRSMKKGRPLSEDMVREDMQRIDSQVERMKTIIDHLRGFARGSTASCAVPVDMNIPLRDCFNLMGQQLKLRDIDIQMELAEIPMVMADSNKLEQVFVNIIGNARDAMDASATIVEDNYSKILKVQSLLEDNQSVVLITDTGGGIPQAYQSKIFEPFFTTKEIGKGTGLGLSISYNLIKDFGGSLDFHVEDGVGTTFRVALPIATEDKTVYKDDDLARNLHRCL